MKRYKPELQPQGFFTLLKMVESADGEWVRYEDAMARAEKAEAEIEALVFHREHNKELKAENKRLRERVSELQSGIAAKDEQIHHLTHEACEWSKGYGELSRLTETVGFLDDAEATIKRLREAFEEIAENAHGEGNMVDIARKALRGEE